jgi:quinol monooxygenase YgiN
MMAYLAAAAAASMVLSVSAYATPTATSANRLAIYAVVHVDVEPKDVAVALPMLRSFEQQARHDSAVTSVEVLQQTGAENHFTLVEVFGSGDAYNDFVARPYVKALRTGLQPLLGGPFDERIHHAMPQDQ